MNMVNPLRYILRKMPLLGQIDFIRTFVYNTINRKRIGFSVLFFPNAQFELKKNAIIKRKDKHCKIHLGCPNFDNHKLLKTCLIIDSNAILYVHGKVMIGTGSVIRVCNRAHVTFGDDLHIGKGCHITLLDSSILGNNVWLSDNVTISGTVNIGQNAWIGENTKIEGTHLLHKDVIIGCDETIYNDL